jgi:hypothetical protein
VRNARGLIDPQKSKVTVETRDKVQHTVPMNDLTPTMRTSMSDAQEFHTKRTMRSAKKHLTLADQLAKDIEPTKKG